MGFKTCFLTRFAALRAISIHDTKLALFFWIALLGSTVFMTNNIIQQKQYQTIENAVSQSVISVPGSIHPVGARNESTMYDWSDLVHTLDSDTLMFTTRYMSMWQPKGVPFVEDHKHQMETHHIEWDTLKEHDRWTLTWGQILLFPKMDYRIRAQPVVLKFEDIVRNLNNTGAALHELYYNGASIRLHYHWSCTIPLWYSQSLTTCSPEIHYHRIDDGSGFNYWWQKDTNWTARHIRKTYGFKVQFEVTGTAGQFSWLNTSIAFGNVMAFCGVIRLTTDLLLVYCMSQRVKYYNQKYDHMYFDEDRGQWVVAEHIEQPDPTPPIWEI